jgi:hypothetical protein
MAMRSCLGELQVGIPEPNSMAAKLPAEQNETPEDVATLYSWANLHGAKYRDFSASRAEAREEVRLRVEDAKAAEQLRLKEEAERKAQEEAQLAARLAAEAAEAARQAEAERLAEIARQAEAEHQAVLAAQEAQRQAALQRSWEPPSPDAYLDGYPPGFPGADILPQPSSQSSAQTYSHAAVYSPDPLQEPIFDRTTINRDHGSSASQRRNHQSVSVHLIFTARPRAAIRAQRRASKSALLQPLRHGPVLFKLTLFAVLRAWRLPRILRPVWGVAVSCSHLLRAADRALLSLGAAGFERLARAS